MTFLFLAAGCVLLFLGGEMVVRGAVALARRFDVSPLVIGLTIVGFGTSLPELLVSLNAALQGAPGLALGNVVGSNLANMMLILGTAALVHPIAVDPQAVRRDGLAMALFTALCILLGLDGSCTAVEGAGMTALLLLYIGLTLRRGMQADDAAARLHREEAEEVTGLPQRLWAMSAVLLAGFAAVGIGAELLVEGARALAAAAGVPEEVIGLTVVAIGTSLPELATSLVAAWRGHSDVCVGNVVGSNIFNLLGILGITAIAVPVPFAPNILGFDLWVLAGVTLLILFFLITGRRVSRPEGGLLVGLYGVYAASQFLGIGGALAVARG